MKIFKAVSAVCIAILFLLICWAFAFAVWNREVVIAMACPVALVVLRVLWWADIEMADKEDGK